MVNKVLIGALLFDQLSSKYLADILDRDNTEPRSDGADDTVQEHRFDEHTATSARRAITRATPMKS